MNFLTAAIKHSRPSPNDPLAEASVLHEFAHQAVLKCGRPRPLSNDELETIRQEARDRNSLKRHKVFCGDSAADCPFISSQGITDTLCVTCQDDVKVSLPIVHEGVRE